LKELNNCEWQQDKQKEDACTNYKDGKKPSEVA
jgi:hypothetical protein